MNQLEQQYQEILHTLDKLLANLGLMLEDYDVEYLTQADLYIEIFKIMFPVLEPVLNADFGEDITDEELIQYLIDVLAKDIIKMDLGHIRGELIAQGDAKNILNFLQLLFEISNMVVEKDDGQKDKRSKKSKNKKLVKSSANSADQTSNNSEQSSLEMNQKYNSVQGINAEFSSSSVAESNREASEAGAEYYEEIVEGQDRNQNKMVFDQHQQMKAMKGDSRGNSRSVSRISEVSKSKESSEYERGIKKLSQKFDDFNPGVVQVKSLVADGAKRGSYTSDDIRELRGENGEEEDELEEEQEVTENEYDQEQQDQHDVRQFTNENEEDEQEEEEYEEEEADQGAHQGEQEYYQETNEDDEVIEEDDGFSEHMIKKISKEEVGDDLEYYSSDPINYNPLGNNKRRHSHEPEREVDRAHAVHAVQSVSMKHKQIEHDEDQEQEEYEEEEIEDQEELVEEDDSQRQFYENDDEYVEEGEEVEDQEQEEIDPRHAEYREEMEEVAEEEYEEEDTENAEPNEALYPQGYYQAQQAQQVAKKSKGTKGKGKTKKVSKKKSPKAKAVEDFKKPKVEYRPLRPATAGMKRPQTANPSKGKVTKAMPVRSSGRKSESTTSSRSKKMAHSKSEKRLNMDEEQEQSQSQSGVHDDYSEDKGMEPKELSPHEDSQIPSQHGHANEYSGIEEEQEQEEEGYQEQVQQNVFKILSDNVSRVKENLREHRAVEDVPFDDENTVKMIRQQKEQYKQYLKDFVKDHQIKEKKYQQMREVGEKNFHKKMKSEKIRDQTIRREFENQQKSLYFKMRDEKVNYLRRIHKTIFELEKKRIIDEKKEYMEFRKTRNIEACNMIESIKNQYKHKLSILRENNTNQQQERKIASEAQRTFIKTLENELRMDQMKEVERLKDKWRLEKERFDMMIKDEGFLEQKVMQLYKKGVF